MNRQQTMTDEMKVKAVHPSARAEISRNKRWAIWSDKPVLNSKGLGYRLSVWFDSEAAAWADAASRLPVAAPVEEIVDSSGNVFADLGLPNAKELQTKARILAAPPSVEAPKRQPHETRPVRVWVDVDRGVAELVEYLNTIPGVRTHASCQGTIGEGGPVPYRPQVMCSWTEEAFSRLASEFDITPTGEGWGYVHPRHGWTSANRPQAAAPDGERERLDIEVEPTWVGELYERSKDDRATIVGSEVRQLVGRIRDLQFALTSARAALSAPSQERATEDQVPGEWARHWRHVVSTTLTLLGESPSEGADDALRLIAQHLQKSSAPLAQGKGELPQRPWGGEKFCAINFYAPILDEYADAIERQLREALAKCDRLTGLAAQFDHERQLRESERDEARRERDEAQKQLEAKDGLKLYVWKDDLKWVAIAHASSVAEARQILSDEIHGDGSTPVRMEMKEAVLTRGPEIFRGPTSEAILTDSGELEEQEHYSHTLSQKLKAAEQREREAVERAKVLEDGLVAMVEEWDELCMNQLATAYQKAKSALASSPTGEA